MVGNNEDEINEQNIYEDSKNINVTNKSLFQSTIKSTQLLNSYNYEWIRVEGKGSFGKAILYKRKIDNTYVIIKEIVMHSLSLSERQSALNEVSLLSQLDHPNIISYYDSFEDEGILMIEMEYADGGNLGQYLLMQQEYLNENVIWFIFTQIVNGVCYLHQNSILHRDLKTANIFLTKTNDVKIGDFGISKIMGTNTKLDGANTVIGTPYYISPEMCEGKSYNESTDIWAMGCILYEMACLQKTFEATNLPALVTHIMKAEYKPVKGPYSVFLKLLIRDLLKVDASLRPSATSIMEMLKKEHKYDDKLRNTGKFNLYKNNLKKENSKEYSEWSALYEFNITNLSLTYHNILPQNKIKIMNIGVGRGHKIFVTNDNQVYVYGDNGNGELGLGNRENMHDKAMIVDFLSDKQIIKVDAGDGYTLFQSIQGVVYFCGKKEMSTIEGATEDVLKPKLIECLLREDIKDIACGPNHAVVISANGTPFVWGKSDDGRLGIKTITSIEENPKFITKPVPLNISNLPHGHIITSARCGYDSTMLLTNLGSILAMGDNSYNKLNITQRQGFFSNKKGFKIDENGNKIVWEPTMLKSFPSRVVDARMGRYNSGVLLESGHIYIFGKNSNGELGIGSLECKKNDISCNVSPKPVKSLLTKGCVLLLCGDNFSLTGTTDELYFWGSRGLISSGRGDLKIEDLESGNNNSGKNIAKEVIVTLPSLVLKLESSTNNSDMKSTIKLCGLYSCGNSKVLVQIDTCIPFDNKPTLNNNKKGSNDNEGGGIKKNFMPQIFKKKKFSNLRREPKTSTSSVDEDNGCCLNDKDFKDNDDKANTWLENELNNATIIPMSFNKEENKKNDIINDEEVVKSLIKEIESLKVIVNEQRSSFSGQEKEMTLLKDKIMELQTLKKKDTQTDDIKKLILDVTSSVLPQISEPPPEYSSQQQEQLQQQNINGNYCGRFNVPTKVCSIL
ncbi:NimA-like kinase [Strongyloides ratti]|uniref:non-specific serine/threonine protein kinase n=1 Tax=Strongyloides ratti TaxID=34506 RepID=A0A090L528_STRRB|nr:NimA-like kinase [Strongyloides ratti]CEF64911.1 NimA-like kinase [Strongyloides ratti]